ncbi:MAG: GGDEF and EAL domain-containing protein [Lachnospiraceae bacterium]|nr:GGDEF and EAL domain-containing protein [Lachnospiraceae bacterium]
MKDCLQNELFEAFANASENVYIYVCDMKTDRSRWSTHAVEYFDLPGEYMVDAGSIWMERIHPHDRDLYGEDIGAIFSGVSDHHYCQYRAKNRYGDYIWLECRGSVIRDEAGKPTIFAGMMTRLDNQNKYDVLTHLLTSHEFRKFDFTQNSGTVLLFGIDDFRKVINSYGYTFGDDILAEFATRMSTFGIEGRLLYRLRGDEFLIISPYHSRTDVKQLFKRIRRLGKELGKKKGHLVNLSISGGAVAFPENGTDRDELLSNLEHSLEQAKTESKGQLIVFSQDIAEKHLRITKIKEALSISIKHNFEGFSLYYQPMISPKDHRVVSCEALLRWQGVNAPVTYPDEFVKILENTGEIKQVGMWVMEEVMKQAAAWKQIDPDIRISFNASYLQFTNDILVDQMIVKARQYRINPRHIMLELTESAGVENPELLCRKFKKLRENGFWIALDDFGTAYSSLELIKKLPADYIKIDHSFVRELADGGHDVDLTIVEGTVSMCNKLGTGVVVEGVENKQVEEIISGMDVSLLQGYLYSKPVPADEYEKILRKGKV